MKPRQVTSDVLAVLDRAAVQGCEVRIIEKLERPLYKKVNDTLEALGGKWTKRAQAHVFPHSPSDALDDVIVTGQLVRPADYGFFPSPPEVVERVIASAMLDRHSVVLEPSAGLGNIAKAAAEVAGVVDCIELLDANVAHLRELDCFRSVQQRDFLEVDPLPIYTHVTMNPPFALGADCRHVEHALRFLRPKGRLVAVMSAGILFRQTNPARSLREWLISMRAQMRHLPEGSFSTVGTDVRTCLVSVTVD